jgi:protocatechuate 3,4-dioxygenase beta subunit
MMNDSVTRRSFLRAALTLPLVYAWPGVAKAQPTPSCPSGEPTLSEIEGPYFKPRSPERHSLLEAGLKGRRLILTGTVISTAACRPAARALLDFWQADADGEYDNAGFRLRGHQYTDVEGHYLLETILPGLYTGRTRHVHVKVQVPREPVLTSQLYFPGEPANAHDDLFRRDLVINVMDGGDPLRARFDFVIAT